MPAKILPTKILAAMGSEPSLMAICPPGFLARFISGQLRIALFPVTQALGFYVLEAWIKEQKRIEQVLRCLLSVCVCVCVLCVCVCVNIYVTLPTKPSLYGTTPCAQSVPVMHCTTLDTHGVHRIKSLSGKGFK